MVHRLTQASFRKGFFRQLLRRLFKEQRGEILVEAAFGLTFLTTLLLGGVEVGRYILLVQKLDRVAMSVTDLASRGEELTDSQVANIFAATDQLLSPFNDPSDRVVIISAIQGSVGSPPKIIWQRVGAGNLIRMSPVGELGNSATLPEQLRPNQSEHIFIGEIIYKYEPFFIGGIIGEKDLYHRAIFRGRLSDILPYDAG